MNKYDLISYIFAVILLVLAILTFIYQNYLGGIVLIFASLFLMRKFDDYLSVKLETTLGWGFRIVIVVVLLLIAWFSTQGLEEVEKVVIEEVEPEDLEYVINESFLLDGIFYKISNVNLVRGIGDASNGTIIGDLAQGIFAIITIELNGTGYIPEISLVINESEYKQDREAGFYVNNSLADYLNGSLSSVVIFDIPRGLENLELKIEEKGKEDQIVIVNLNE